MTDTRQPASLPRSLAIWGDELAKIRLPEGPFDPAGQWSQLYSVYVLAPFHKMWRGIFLPSGALRLTRAPGEGSAFTLSGRRWTATVERRTWIAIDWSVRCAADRLATPIEWEFVSDLLDTEFRPVAPETFRYLDVGPGAYQSRTVPMPSARFAFKGRLRDGVAENEKSRPVTLTAGAAATSNWSLLEALQRLAPELKEPLAFDLLEDFELHKPGQRLCAAGSHEVTFAGGPVRLHGFRQVGPGVLPWEYWLTEQGRLVLASGGYKGFVLNPDEPLGGKLA